MNNSNASYFLPYWAVCVFLKARDSFSLVSTRNQLAFPQQSPVPARWGGSRDTAMRTHMQRFVCICARASVPTQEMHAYVHTTHVLQQTWAHGCVLNSHWISGGSEGSWWDQSFVGFCFLLILVVWEQADFVILLPQHPDPAQSFALRRPRGYFFHLTSHRMRSRVRSRYNKET